MTIDHVKQMRQSMLIVAALFVAAVLALVLFIAWLIGMVAADWTSINPAPTPPMQLETI